MKKVLAVVMLLSLLMVFALAQPIVKSSMNLTSIFFEPDAGETPFVNLINGAESSLKIEVYVMTARDVFDAIHSAINRGVKAEVILTAHPYNMQAQANYAYEQLKAMGAEVRWAPLRFAYDHAKFMVADGKKAIVGTSNLTYSGISQNFEANVLTSDPEIVKALVNVFNADWNNVPAGSAPREYLVLSPKSAGDFEWLIKSAKKSLKISEEEVPEGVIFNALKAAAGRGVKVQLVEPYSNLKRAEGRYALSELEKAGVKVKTIKSPYIHAKMMIVDANYLFIGSENVSYTSLYQNREVGVILSNSSLISKATQRFNELWSNANALEANITETTMAFLPQIVAHPFNYMNKLVRTIGTVEAVFGKNVFVSYPQGNKLAGIMLWLGHVSEVPNLKAGDTVRIVGGVNVYKGQLEISVVSPLEIISSSLLPLPFEPTLEKLKDYNALKVLVKGVYKFSSDGTYIGDGKTDVKLEMLGGALPKIAAGTEIYVEGIVMTRNGNSVLVPTRFYTANEYASILEKNAIKSNPTLAELRENPQLYYAQTVTSTGIVTAIVSASNAYIWSNGSGMRIYGTHGKIKPGDVVLVKGSFTSYGGSFEIDVNSVKIVGHTSEISPLNVKLNDIPKYPEALVKVSGVVTKANKRSFYISNGNGKVYVYSPKIGVPLKGEKVTVIGIAVKYKNAYEVYALKIEN